MPEIGTPWIASVARFEPLQHERLFLIEPNSPGPLAHRIALPDATKDNIDDPEVSLKPIER